MRTFTWASASFLILGVLCVLGLQPRVGAQVAMPDPKQMAGIPRPEGADPNGSLTVRLIRGSLSNNIAGHPVELRIGNKGDKSDKIQTVKTDDEGRARFEKLPAGTMVKAVAVVDGERLESQEFPVAAMGGIRLMLVATDRDKEARAAEAAKAPAVTGEIVLGGETRLVIEPGDESVELFYLLDIVNHAATPVNTPTLFTFAMPTGAGGVTLFAGSSPLAAVTGTHVRVQGPFPPGTTSLQVAGRLPITGASAAITQRFPAKVEQLLVVVKKFGDTRLSSPQIQRQQDMVAEGAIVGAGGTIAADQPIELTLSGLPHHSTAPRTIAVTLAAVIAVIGVWAFRRQREVPVQKDERKRLVARREKLFQDLVRLENDHRNGRGDGARYATRREELMASLERVYGALDTDDLGPGPASGDRAGLAA